jgi:hypothetical protein
MRGSFTCRKVGTWNRLFNFPSEGRQAEDFYIEKNPTASAGFEPANIQCAYCTHNSPINSDYFPTKHSQTGLYPNEEVRTLQYGKTKITQM